MITLDGTNGITTPDVEVDSIGTSTSTAVTIRTNNVERVKVDSSGNVGIGTSSAASALNVVGDQAIIASSSGTGSLGIQIKGTALSGIPAGQVQGYIATGQSDIGTAGDLLIAPRTNVAASVRFITGTTPTERARIDASGNLLIGTTSLPNGTTTGGSAFQANNGNRRTLLMATTESSGNMAAFFTSSGLAGTISVSGSSTAYNTSSDYRLKEDVHPMVGSVDRLMALKPVNFAWKADGSRTDGFLAHEAQEVVPEAVTGSKDAVDKDGKPIYQGIDQSKLVPLLTAALQEALIEISRLKADVALLKGTQQ